ncbi:MAG: ABC transporter ATP-binding protein/permease, partial [SAR324 cluster bacterium]|nr:ABC transporter ATP-binding protein/permease [SAR324 cluster bacterium]
MKEKELDTQVVESTWSNIWRILSPYWWSEERKSACGLLLVIIGLNLSLVYLTVLFNEWNRFFYDALQNKDFEEFTKQILRFSVIAFVYIAIAVYRVYLSQMLEIRWRRWLTGRYIKWWIGDHVYYRMSLYKDRTDNPDQRISEDFKLFTSGALSLSLGFLNASVSVFAFVGILWGLSGPLSFQLFGHNLTVSGYLVWVALLYAV